MSDKIDLNEVRRIAECSPAEWIEAELRSAVLRRNELLLALVDERSQLAGGEIDKDLGIAGQHRARLRARIAGNVASGYLAGASHDASLPLAYDVADYCSDVADAILIRCGL